MKFLDKLKNTIIFELEKLNKNGTTYLKVVDSNLKMEPKKIHFKLDNLFDGNAVLGKAINQILNNNWEEVYKDVKTGYQAAFAQVFQSIFNNLLEKVSADELFDNNYED